MSTNLIKLQELMDLSQFALYMLWNYTNVDEFTHHIKKPQVKSTKNKIKINLSNKSKKTNSDFIN